MSAEAPASRWKTVTRATGPGVSETASDPSADSAWTPSVRMPSDSLYIVVVAIGEGCCWIFTSATYPPSTEAAPPGATWTSPTRTSALAAETESATRTVRNQCVRRTLRHWFATIGTIFGVPRIELEWAGFG
jgi:hypothetical protein